MCVRAQATQSVITTYLPTYLLKKQGSQKAFKELREQLLKQEQDACTFKPMTNEA